jgi:hypothetical protein
MELTERATEIREHFTSVYADDLTERLNQAAESGTLDEHLNGDFVCAEDLEGADDLARQTVAQNFGWHTEDADMVAALEQPGCYAAVNFTGIIDTARKLNAR